MQAKYRKKYASPQVCQANAQERPYSIYDTHAIQCFHRSVLSDVHVGSTSPIDIWSGEIRAVNTVASVGMGSHTGLGLGL